MPNPALIMGAIGLAGAVLDGMEENDRMRDKARAYGIKDGGIMFSANRNSEMLVTQAAAIKEAEILQKMSVDEAQAKAEAEARVIAAQAGVAGDSVDSVISGTERNAVKVKQQIDKDVRNKEHQLGIDYVDIQLGADLQKGVLNTDTGSKTGRILEGGLAFLKGFQTAL